jgi:streptogramin lyase
MLLRSNDSLSYFVALAAAASPLLAQQPCESFPRSGSSSDTHIASAPNGTVWYADRMANLLVRVNADRTHNSFTPNTAQRGTVTAMTVAPDGRVWYATAGAGTVGFIAANGSAGREWPLPRASGPAVGRLLPSEMVAATDGTIWVIDPVQNLLTRVTGDGVATPFPVPREGSRGLLPSNIAVDAAGAVWFASSGRDLLYRFVPNTSAFTTVALPSAQLQPKRIAIASDGAVWIAVRPQRDSGQVLRYDGTSFTALTIGPGRAEYLLPDRSAGVWFSKPLTSTVGYVTALGAMATMTCGAVGPLVFGPDRRPWSLGSSMLVLPASLTPSTNTVALGPPNAERLRREAGMVEVVPTDGLAARIRDSRGTVYLHLTSNDRNCGKRGGRRGGARSRIPSSRVSTCAACQRWFGLTTAWRRSALPGYSPRVR